ncbi:unnamed protein product [Symbiodinium sp. CCMP2592]|nr:unnamed protein product [Symbiodinium sp. CCMP2592]
MVVVDDLPSWGQVCKLSARFAQSKADLNNEILWPLTVYCLMSTPPDVDAYPMTMFCISGHGLVFAWYVAMFKALEAADLGYIRQLWRCGLSASITLHWTSVPRQILMVALSASENYGSAEDLVETFPVFAQRVDALLAEGGKSASKLDDRVDYLNEKNVKHRGNVFNKGLLNACIAMRRFSPKALATLRKISHEHGNAVLTDGYVKLDDLVTEAIEWTVESAYVALSRADCKVDFFKTQHLESSKDKSQAGWFVVTLQKFMLVHHLLTLPAKLELPLLSDALEMVSTPSAWDLNFPKVETEDAESEETSKGGPEAIARLAKLTEEQKSFFSFVRSILEGDFNEDMNGVCGGKNFKMVDEIYKEATPHKKLEVFTEFNTVLKGLSAVKVHAATSESSAPSLSVKSLARLKDEESQDAQKMERQAIWAKAQAQRRKLVNFAVASDLATAMDKPQAESVRSMTGKLNESHRLFVMSLDLVSESSATPWSTPSAVDKAEVQRLYKFMEKHATRESDFILAFCGRSASNRRILEDSLNVLNCPSTVTEMWVAYYGKDDERPGRKVFGGAPHREVGFLKGMVARVRLTTKDDFIPTEQGAGNRDFWSAILEYTCCKSVVDCTPGSGMLATQCLEDNIPYYGLVKGSTHLAWVSNVLDLAALKMILSESEHPLYQQSLKECIEQHFQDEMMDRTFELTEDECKGLRGEDDAIKA